MLGLCAASDLRQVALGVSAQCGKRNEPGGTFGRVIGVCAEGNEAYHVLDVMVDAVEYIADATEG